MNIFVVIASSVSPASLTRSLPNIFEYFNIQIESFKRKFSTKIAAKLTDFYQRILYLNLRLFGTLI